MAADKSNVSVKGQGDGAIDDGKRDMKESINQQTANEETEPQTSYWSRYVQHRIHFMSF